MVKCFWFLKFQTSQNQYKEKKMSILKNVFSNYGLATNIEKIKDNFDSSTADVLITAKGSAILCKMKTKEVVPSAYFDLFAVVRNYSRKLENVELISTQYDGCWLQGSKKAYNGLLISPFRPFSLHGILNEKSYLVCGPFSSQTECSIICGKNEIEIQKSIRTQFNTIIVGHIQVPIIGDLFSKLSLDLIYKNGPNVTSNVYLLL